MLQNIKSVHGIDYEITLRKFLNLSFYSLKSLDDAIDQLCIKLGEAFLDDALKEDYCPYFGVPWEAGLGLAQFLTKANVRGLKVLEIGSGLSLPSFIAAGNGAHVTATDFHADVETFLKLNQSMNKISFNYFQMNWRVQHHEIGKFDLVIGSDILYESGHPDYVADALIMYLAPGGKIILSDPGRAYIQKFVSSMEKKNFKTHMMIESVQTEWTKKDVFIFEFIPN
jgi:predicted nicotinamide N-methyase